MILRRALGRFPFLRGLLSPLLLIRRKVLQHRMRKKEGQFNRLFSNVHGGRVIIGVEHFPGRFEIDADSDILKTVLITKRFEPELALLARSYVVTGHDVIDVGANVGFYTVLFSKALQDGGRVLAIEPASSAIDCLRKNLQSNDCLANTIVFEGVASDKKGRYALNRIPGKEEYSSLGRICHPSVLEFEPVVQAVEGESIDDLVLRFGLKPGMMKIDTEGSEPLVILGAAATLEEFHPVIMMELSADLLSSFGYEPRQVLTMLKGHGYQCRDALSLEEIDDAPPSGNMLALPPRLQGRRAS